MLKSQDPLTEIHLHARHLERMRRHVIQDLPKEACGLVAGRNGTSIEVYPVENVLDSPNRFLMDAEQQLKIFQTLERRGWDLLAIYHSHPTGPPQPSATDVEETYYPDAISLIWSRLANEWMCRAFVLRNKIFREITLRIESSQQSHT
ncbi:MAG: M67 family metallopeptidase [Gammaproteobacteria bacterium]|nr:M67 family metallopeptidase [Gammaproteobacteria bacterium]